MTRALRRVAGVVPPALRRLAALAPLDPAAMELLELACDRIERFNIRSELFAERRPVGGPWLILDGWTARVRDLPDGRRQLVSFGIAGDLIGYCQFENAIASSTMVALTPVVVCPLPDSADQPSLAQAYAISRALDEAYLMAQVTRLGRLNAHERIADLLLEFYERLKAIGWADWGKFSIPLTQETISDALGLTPVHLNRTLQSMRRAGELIWTGREITLRDPAALAFLAGHIAPRVSD